MPPRLMCQVPHHSGNLGANVTTRATQTYNGATTLETADRNLTASTVNFGDTITGTGSHDLTITGALDLDGALTDVLNSLCLIHL
jgi:hypothetical protein